MLASPRSLPAVKNVNGELEGQVQECNQSKARERVLRDEDQAASPDIQEDF
jgi:hypothetical protein